MIERHRETFVDERDFARIAARGFDAVRLQVPWFVFGEDGPMPGPSTGCIGYVDAAFDWAEAAGVSVLLDVAVAPARTRPLQRASSGTSARFASACSTWWPSLPRAMPRARTSWASSHRRGPGPLAPGPLARGGRAAAPAAQLLPRRLRGAARRRRHPSRARAARRVPAGRLARVHVAGTIRQRLARQPHLPLCRVDERGRPRRGAQARRRLVGLRGARPQERASRHGGRVVERAAARGRRHDARGAHRA